MTPGLVLTTSAITLMTVDVAAETPPFLAVSALALQSRAASPLVLIALSTSEI